MCNFAAEFIFVYMNHDLLKGKRGIIFGALNEDSIAWKVAVKAVEEGARITLSNTPMALRMGELDGLSKQLDAPVIPADATSVEDLEKVFAQSVELLGGKIDFVLHSIGMSPNAVHTMTSITIIFRQPSTSLPSLSTRCCRWPRSRTP